MELATAAEARFPLASSRAKEMRKRIGGRMGVVAREKSTGALR